MLLGTEYIFFKGYEFCIAVGLCVSNCSREVLSGVTASFVLCCDCWLLLFLSSFVCFGLCNVLPGLVIVILV